MHILVQKDGDGYLARVRGQAHLFAWGETKEVAKTELLHVVDMIMDYHLEQVEIDRKVKTKLTAA